MLIFCRQSIQPLRTGKLKPYVIFIKAPSLDRLRQTRRNARIITNCSVNRAFTVRPPTTSMPDDTNITGDGARWRKIEVKM